MLFGPAFEARAGAIAVGSLLVLAPLYLTYSFAFEWRFGRTPGKVNRGLLVVTEDGGDPGVRACAVRNLLRYVDLSPGNAPQNARLLVLAGAIVAYGGADTIADKPSKHRIDPRNPVVHQRLGYVYTQSGQLDEAEVASLLAPLD